MFAWAWCNQTGLIRSFRPTFQVNDGGKRVLPRSSFFHNGGLSLRRDWASSTGMSAKEVSV